MVSAPARAISALAAAWLLVACSGGSSGGSPAASIPAATQSAAPSPAGDALVTFKINWPASSATASLAKRSRYLPATARSASIAANGGVPQYLNSPTAPLTFSAPTGLDTFVVQSYDEQNGKGNVLSSADLTQTVSGTKANIVSATLNGVIATLNIVLSKTSPPAGAKTTVSVTATGIDADGNTIVGPGDYDRPITLSIVDPAKSGTLSLSKTLLQSPGGAVTMTYSGGSLASASIVASASGVPAASATFAPAPTIYQIHLPKAASRPVWIVAGPDGKMWFTDAGTNSIGKVASNGTVVEYSIPTASSVPWGIVAGGDGRLWFTERGAPKIGAVTTTGTIQEFSTLHADDSPYLLVDRGDGTVWYTSFNSDRIGYQSETVGGGKGEFTLPSGSGPNGIATAPDNNVYFTESSVSKIGRISNIGGAIQEISLTPDTFPQAIVRGPDGNLWFAELVTSKIGRLSPSSFSVTEFPSLTPSGGTIGIAAGKDGALWFTEPVLNRIGRVTTSGTMSEYTLPSLPVPFPQFLGIGVAADGSIWFCEEATNVIGHLVW